jgi:hypothetical protein
MSKSRANRIRTWAIGTRLSAIVLDLSLPTGRGGMWDGSLYLRDHHGDAHRVPWPAALELRTRIIMCDSVMIELTNSPAGLSWSVVGTI